MTLALWRRYGALYRPTLPLLAAAIVISALGSLLVVPVVLLVRFILDTILPAGDMRQLLLASGAILFVILAGTGAVLWTRHVTLRITKTAIQRLREQAIEKLHTLPRAYRAQASGSTLHTTIVQDTERLDITSNALIVVLLPALVAGLGLSAVLAAMQWRLFLVLLSTAPLVWLFGRHLKRLVGARVRDFHRAFERFSEGALFVLQKMDLIRIQSAEAVERARQREALDRLRQASGDMAWLQTAQTQLFATFAWISSVMVLIAGGALVVRGTMTLGDLLAFYLAAGLLNGTVHQMSAAIPQVIAGHESLVTLYTLLDAPEALPYHGDRKIAFRGEIAFEAVSFRYAERPILRDLNLVLEPHSTTAIVGPNGSGKSTMLYLVLGFYRPKQGRLLADGHPFDDLDLAHLRRFMGVVMQDPILFPGTVLQNLTYGAPEASRADVERAAELATADGFVRELPRGYDTVIGDEGVLLSGGQRQRIAVARALLRRPRLLLLDEPANHLDDDGVERLLANLRTLDDVPAILTISHDLHIARQAERVFRLDQGGLTPWNAHA